MTILSEQLKQIFAEITSSFAHHPQIEVTPVSGDPPEQYRLTYNVQGLCQHDGSITPCSSHTVLISFPFGFPHFPPNCRPESPIFHPDFDQSAICLGEFWDNTHSLPELILHIGRMISGEIFSTVSTFNEEAAVWYKEHPDRLPFDTIRAADDTNIAEEVAEPEPIELLIETVDIEPQADLPDPPQEEPATYDSPSMEEHLSPSPADMNTRPATANSKQLADIQKKHQAGETHEHQGRPGKALEIYQDIRELMPDFPGIDSDIARAEYAVSMLGDWAADDKGVEETPPPPSQKKSAKSPKRPSTPAPSASTAPGSPDKTKSPTRRIPMALVIPVCFLLIILTAAWFYMGSQMDLAQERLAECKQLANTDLFVEANKKCTEALHASTFVWIIKQQPKQQLTGEIQQIIDSPKFKEGLAQNRTKDAATLTEWEMILEKSDLHAQEKKWKEALDGYTKVLQLIENKAAIDPATTDSVRQKIIMTRSSIFIEAGEKALAGADWSNAKYNLTKASELSQQNPLITSHEHLQKIGQLLRQVEFNDLMTAGETSYGKGEWKEALSNFEQAQKTEHESPFADPEILLSLQEVIARSKVFHTLELGKEAFTNSQWDQATQYYESAIKLLDENREVLRRDDPEKSQQKIARLLLHTAIIKEKQKIAMHHKNKELDSAKDAMRTLLAMVTKSEFAKEPDFLKISRETEEDLAKAEEELYIKEQVDYLTDNYQKLFIQNNPSLSPESLSNPKVTFLKKIGNQHLFRLQCSEEGHGRPVILQSSYLHDPLTKKWTLHISE